MKSDRDLVPIAPLDGRAVQELEAALLNSPSKSIRVEVNETIYDLSREGRWFKFSLLNKKNTVKKATIFQTITEVYNQAMHGQAWRIAHPGV